MEEQAETQPAGREGVLQPFQARLVDFGNQFEGLVAFAPRADAPGARRGPPPSGCASGRRVRSPGRAAVRRRGCAASGSSRRRGRRSRRARRPPPRRGHRPTPPPVRPRSPCAAQPPPPVPAVPAVAGGRSLPLALEREAVDAHEEGWQHEVRQRRRKSGAQLTGVEFRRSHVVADQVRAAYRRIAMPRPRRRVRREARRGGRVLRRVRPGCRGSSPGRRRGRGIRGCRRPASGPGRRYGRDGRRRRRVDEEALGVQLRPVQVAAGDADASYIARRRHRGAAAWSARSRTYRRRLSIGRPIRDPRGVVAGAFMVGHVDGGLGQSVQVDQSHGVAEQPAEARDLQRREGFAAAEHQAQQSLPPCGRSGRRRAGRGTASASTARSG